MSSILPYRMQRIRQQLSTYMRPSGRSDHERLMILDLGARLGWTESRLGNTNALLSVTCGSSTAKMRQFPLSVCMLGGGRQTSLFFFLCVSNLIYLPVCRASCRVVVYVFPIFHFFPIITYCFMQPYCHGMIRPAGTLPCRRQKAA